MSEILRSGIHDITPDQQIVHGQVKKEIQQDLLPFKDRQKISDDDLIYRFLIARQWKEKEAIKGLKEYAAWREELSVNEIFEYDFPAPILKIKCGYCAADKQGYPVYYDLPDPSVLSALIKEQPRPELVKWHVLVAELGRLHQRTFSADRITVVLDASLLGLSIVTSPSVMSILKEFAHIDQQKYPENMYTMLVINAPRSFRYIFRAASPLLEERVKRKIRVLGSVGELEIYIEKECIPEAYGGTCQNFLTVAEEVEKLRAASAARHRPQHMSAPSPPPPPTEVKSEPEVRVCSTTQEPLTETQVPVIECATEEFPVERHDEEPADLSVTGKKEPETWEEWQDEIDKDINFEEETPEIRTPSPASSRQCAPEVATPPRCSSPSESFSPQLLAAISSSSKKMDTRALYRYAPLISTRPLPLLGKLLTWTSNGEKSWNAVVFHVTQRLDEIIVMRQGAREISARISLAYEIGTLFLLDSVDCLGFTASPSSAELQSKFTPLSTAAALAFTSSKGGGILVGRSLEEALEWVNWVWSGFPHAQPLKEIPSSRLFQALLTETTSLLLL